MGIAVLDQLHREHASIAGVLFALEREARRLERGQEPDYELMQLALEYLLGFPDRCHHPREDQVFRRLQQRNRLAAAAVGDLLQLHAALAESVRAFAQYLGDVLGGAIVPRQELVRRAHDFIDRQWQHMAMEEANFFPAAEKALGPDDWSAVAAGKPEAMDPLTAAAAGRFEKLREEVLAWQQDNELTRRNSARTRAP